MDRLALAGRLAAPGRTLQYITYFDDFPVSEITNVWMDSVGELSKTYVVQTSSRIIERCLLMVTDPGDLILIQHVALEHRLLLLNNGAEDG